MKGKRAIGIFNSFLIHLQIELNYEAACKAKQSSALESASSYLRNARKVFTADALQTDYTRAFEVLYLLAECECSAGNVPEAINVSFFFVLKKKKNKQRKKADMTICVDIGHAHAQHYASEG
jgi:hypothetical protein